MLTLGQAAKLTGLGKTTVTRAIKAGRLSANRNDDGSYSIDPAELSRVYSVRPETLETVAHTGHVVHHATPQTVTGVTGGDTDVTARLATLEEQVRGLRELLEEVKGSRDEWKSQSDLWKEQASRLVHALPAPKSVTPPETLPPRAWWQRLVG